MFRNGELQCRGWSKAMDIRQQSRTAPSLYELWPDGIFLSANSWDGLLWFISDAAGISAFRPHCRRSLRFSERIAKHVWAIPSVSKLDRRSSWTSLRFSERITTKKQAAPRLPSKLVVELRYSYQRSALPLGSSKNSPPSSWALLSALLPVASRVYSLYCRPCSVLLVTTIDLLLNSQLVKWLKYLGAKLQRNYQIWNTIHKAFYIAIVWYFSIFDQFNTTTEGKIPRIFRTLPLSF